MSENEYEQYWTAQVFRGEADAEPLTVPSVGMQKEALRLFPGAISLVTVRDVKPGMKVIRVDGLLPQDTRSTKDRKVRISCLSTPPAGSRRLPVGRFPRRNIRRKYDAIPDRVQHGKSIASPPGIARP